MLTTATIPSEESLSIGGHWQSSAKTESRFDRWTGDMIGEVAVGGGPEAAAAVDAASCALELSFSVPERSRVLAAVDSSDYGLNVAIYTADLAAAMRFGREAQARSVLVNLPPSFRADHMPYGGVKSSGQGREGVKYAVEELVHRKLIVLKP